MELGDVPLEQRAEAALFVITSEPMSVWGRAEVLQAAIWPRVASIPEPPPLRVEWKMRGRTSTPVERAELAHLREAGWTVGAISNATGWSVGQVIRWTRSTT